MIPEIKKQIIDTGKHVDLREVSFTTSEAGGLAAVFQDRVKKEGLGTGSTAYQININKDSAMAAGSYTLDIKEQSSDILAGSDEGIASALTTLYILIRNGKGIVNAQHIEDEPKYMHRGFQIDIARHFLNADEICEVIEEMALLKLNRCHLYFSDDYGYRLESRVHPELNVSASWRTEKDGSRYGGFLTWDDVRRIVAFAADRGIQMIPEIDMPGHTSSWLATYPYLGCFDQEVKVQIDPGISKDVLCVSKESTYDFVTSLLDEVVPLFPYEYFHIGGDEVPTDSWEKCPNCQAMIKAKGFKNEWDLQLMFMDRIIKYLNGKGKKIICWNDILKSGKFPDNAMIHYWHEAGFQIDPKSVKAGTKFVFSFSRGFYFDFDEPLVPIRNTYTYPLKYVCGEPINEENIAGFEAENWAEFTYSKEQLLAKMFPKTYALAERCWNGSGDMGHLMQLIEEEKQYKDYSYKGELVFADWLAHSGS